MPSINASSDPNSKYGALFAMKDMDKIRRDQKIVKTKLDLDK